MTFRISRLTLSLLPLLAAIPAVASDAGDDGKVTRLPAVHATVEESPASAASLDAWGQLPPEKAPASIAIIGRDQLDARQPRTLSELARLDASLGDNYAPVGYYQNLAIRGRALDLGTGYRGNNLVLVGEQRIALEDKERVEILKGVAGLAAGVVEPGGLVNFVSKRPAEVRTLTLGADAEGSRYAALDAGHWLTPSFGLRANLAWEGLESDVRHADGRRLFAALAADWKVSDATYLQLDANHQDSAQRSASGYQLLGGRVIPTVRDRHAMLGWQSWQRPVGMRSSNLGLRLEHAFSADWSLQVAAGRSRSVIDDYTAFAYGCWYAAACASGAPGNAFGPDGSYDIYDYRNPDDRRSTDQLRATLSGNVVTGRIRHALDVSASTMRRDISRLASVNAYIGTGNIGAPPPVLAPSPKQTGIRVTRLDSRQRSLGLVDRMELGNGWQLIAGAQRVTIDEVARDKRDAIERQGRLSRVLPQAALSWQASAGAMAYASYAEGLALGLEAPSWTSNDGQSLAPRLTRQVEVGGKIAGDGPLSVNLAVFRMQQPYQYAMPDASWAGFTFVERGRLVHRGVELGVDGQIADGLRLHGSLAAISARAHGTGTVSIDGRQAVNVPRLRASTQLDYSLPAAPSWAFQLGWRHASRNPATPDGAVGVPAYDVFDAGIRHAGRIGARPVTVQLSVDNLANRFYWRDTGSSQGDNYLFPGAPRQARLSVRIGL